MNRFRLPTLTGLSAPCATPAVWSAAQVAPWAAASHAPAAWAMSSPSAGSTTAGSTTLSPVTEAPPASDIDYDLSDLGPWREFVVVLHDDDVHSQIEVVMQLMKALQCPMQVAHMLMSRVEAAGKAVVAMAPRERALRIGSILRQINLTVEVRQIN